MKTVLQHILDIEDEALREKCLANLDPRCADLTCYSVGYALMLGVEQPPSEKKYWQEAYLLLNKGNDYSEFYKKVTD